VLEKREICRKRLEPERAKEKLSDFGKNFMLMQVKQAKQWVEAAVDAAVDETS